jgi:hypothetical protein
VRRGTFAAAVIGAGCLTMLALPGVSAGGTVDDLVDEVTGTVRSLVPGQAQPAPAPAAPVQQRQAAPRQEEPPPYQPPAHGTNPHGQGSVLTLDVNPSDQRPLAGDPTGEGDAPEDREELIVGRSRGEQQADGKYHGEITVLSISLLGGMPIVVGVETAPGESRSGPLDVSLFDDLCEDSNGFICLSVLNADSETTSSGSSNRFRIVGAQIAREEGVVTTVGESNGNISEDANCQTSHGDSTLVDAGVLGLFGDSALTVAESSTDSRDCRGGPSTQTNDSSLLSLLGEETTDCAGGNPDITLIGDTFLQLLCNADDTNGQGEPVTQAVVPYGVREALTLRLALGGIEVDSGQRQDEELLGLKLTTAASESRAVAPPAPPSVTTPGGTLPVVQPQAPTPESDQGGEAGETAEGEDGAAPRRVTGGTVPARATGRRVTTGLAFTGADLILLVLTGCLTLAAGLWLYRRVDEVKVSA